jgi:hypothetical protein
MCGILQPAINGRAILRKPLIAGALLIETEIE